MTAEEVLPYGERIVGLPEVAQELLGRPFDDVDGPPHEPGPTEYHALRGLIIAQCTEIEAATGMILTVLDPTVNLRKVFFKDRIDKIKALLAPPPGSSQDVDLKAIDEARLRRNHIVHAPVVTIFNYTPYLPGSGDWVPVLTVQGEDEVDLGTLWDDLALQQNAMRAAVRLWAGVTGQMP
ncbi:MULTISPECIES: hypothetical protein [unclassified Streptomyces]|uniref:hypothetical protein n=1 Tax=unclassified Streptomyces TaxID=2593676 RepID=UPI00380C45BD